MTKESERSNRKGTNSAKGLKGIEGASNSGQIIGVYKRLNLKVKLKPEPEPEPAPAPAPAPEPALESGSGSGSESTISSMSGNETINDEKNNKRSFFKSVSKALLGFFHPNKEGIAGNKAGRTHRKDGKEQQKVVKMPPKEASKVHTKNQETLELLQTYQEKLWKKYPDIIIGGTYTEEYSYTEKYSYPDVSRWSAKMRQSGDIDLAEEDTIDKLFTLIIEDRFLSIKEQHIFIKNIATHIADSRKGQNGYKHNKTRQKEFILAILKAMCASKDYIDLMTKVNSSEATVNELQQIAELIKEAFLKNMSKQEYKALQRKAEEEYKKGLVRIKEQECSKRSIWIGGALIGLGLLYLLASNNAQKPPVMDLGNVASRIGGAMITGYTGMPGKDGANKGQVVVGTGYPVTAINTNPASGGAGRSEYKPDPGESGPEPKKPEVPEWVTDPNSRLPVSDMSKLHEVEFGDRFWNLVRERVEKIVEGSGFSDANVAAITNVVTAMMIEDSGPYQKKLNPNFNFDSLVPGEKIYLPDDKFTQIIAFLSEKLSKSQDEEFSDSENTEAIRVAYNKFANEYAKLSELEKKTCWEVFRKFYTEYATYLYFKNNPVIFFTILS